MRIRSTVAGLVLGAGVLVLGAPIAMADNGSQPAPPTSTRVTERPAAPSATTTKTTASPTSAPFNTAPPRATPADGRPAIVKPDGAPETGGGMEDSSSGTGALVIGGIALVVVAGGGSVAYRRLRKQS